MAYAAQVTMGLVIAPFHPGRFGMPLTSLAFLAAVAVAGMFLRESGTTYADLGLRRPDRWPVCLGWAAGAFVVVKLGSVTLDALIHLTTNWPRPDLVSARDAVAGASLVDFMVISLLTSGSAAFGEELVFRGFVMARLRCLSGSGRAGAIVAVVGQAAIFGLLHAFQGPTGAVMATYAALVLAATYYLSGRNLWATILAHGAIDMFVLTMLFLGW